MLGQPLGEIERARPADVVRVEVVELGLERGIGLGRLVGALQVEDQRHQRLGDEAAAEVAEVAALVGAGAEGVGLGSPSSCRPSPCLQHPLHDCAGREACLAVFAARRKRRMSSGPSRRAGARRRRTRRPRAAPVRRMASATLSGVSPPDSMKASLSSTLAERCQSKATPLPPGSASARSAGPWRRTG